VTGQVGYDTCKNEVNNACKTATRGTWRSRGQDRSVTSQGRDVDVENASDEDSKKRRTLSTVECFHYCHQRRTFLLLTSHFLPLAQQLSTPKLQSRIKVHKHDWAGYRRKSFALESLLWYNCNNSSYGGLLIVTYTTEFSFCILSWDAHSVTANPYRSIPKRLWTPLERESVPRFNRRTFESHTLYRGKNSRA
jgi:hypothetical protein